MALTRQLLVFLIGWTLLIVLIMFLSGSKDNKKSVSQVLRGVPGREHSNNSQHEHRGTRTTQVVRSETPSKSGDTEAKTDHIPAHVTVLDRHKTRMMTPAPRKKLEPRVAQSSFIGDSYASEDLPLQSQCPDGIRNQVMNSTIRGKFLQNIPVQLLFKHVTPEEHRRLSPYKPVNGWRDVPYDTVRETLSLLSSSPDWRLCDDWQNRSMNSQCIRCAVVGNGGILKNSTKGKEIDSHHYVFRANGAILKGFEADVGSRTTHYTFTSTTLRRAYRFYRKLGFRGPPQSEETRYLLLPSHQSDYLLVKAAVTHAVVQGGPDRGKNPADIFGPNLSVKKFKMLHPDFMRYIRNRFLLTKHLRRTVNMYRASTGAAMLLTALHTCDQVSAYGFMTPDYSRYSKHYYDTTHQPMRFNHYHDFKMEMNLWQQLHKDGLIHLYMR